MNYIFFVFILLLLPVEQAKAYGQIRGKVNSFSNALESGDLIHTAKAGGKLINGLQNYEWQYGGSILNLHIDPSMSSPSFNLKITFSVVTTIVTKAPSGNGKPITSRVGQPQSVTFNSLEEILNNPNVPDEIKNEVRNSYLPKLKQFNLQQVSISNKIKEEIKIKKSRVRDFNELKEYDSGYKNKIKVPLEQLTKEVPKLSIIID